MIPKKDMKEAEIRAHYIDPALEASGWSLDRLRLEYTLTAGRIVVVDGAWNRGENSEADYVLMPRPDLLIGVVEAKDNKHTIEDGIQQALDYAGLLDLPFAASSNGDGFLFHDKTGLLFDGDVERRLAMDQFPEIDTLLSAFYRWKGWDDEDLPVVSQPYYQDPSGKEPRYYQRLAVQRALEDVHAGGERGLLIMATGTGKTYTAFQIIHRLKASKRISRVLFLADRNILIDQAFSNDFKPFGLARTKVQNRTIDKSFEVYMCLYQAVTSKDPEKDIYKQFSPDFFDLVIVDECHRGSADEDSAWRDVLDHFEGAYHLGLTATPREDKHVSTQEYFGEPLYTYSLKQGINDGFLAPFQVIQVNLDKDMEGWRPPEGAVDMLGQTIEDRTYNRRDMEQYLAIEERTERVASRIAEHMQTHDVYGKAIVFCVDTDHAARMRSALINEFNRRAIPELTDPLERVVMRITGNDDEGKMALDSFINPRERLPVVATTSRLLSTGVDAQTCKLIVIDQEIRSKGLFKQIIGRGTRINERYGKTWFTIMDFRGATTIFADPDWDGEPEIIYEGAAPTPVPREPREPRERSGKYYVSGVPVEVISERVIYLDEDGRQVTVSLIDYCRAKVFERFGESLDGFLSAWNSAGHHQELLDEMKENGFFFEEVKELAGLGDIDPFDLVCHVVYNRPPLTRQERANNVKKRDVYTKYGEQGRAVIDSLLEKYAAEGSVPSAQGLRIAPLSEMGTPSEIVGSFGGLGMFREAMDELLVELYA